MLTELFTKVQDVLQNNAFAQGGFVIAVIGSIIAYARGVPGRLKSFILGKIILTVTIEETSNLYLWFESWLDAQTDVDKKSNIRAASAWSWVTKSCKVVYSIGMGNHRLKIKDFWTYVSRGDDRKGGNSANGSSAPSPAGDSLVAKKNYSVMTWRWNRLKLKAFLESLHKEFQTNAEIEKSTHVFYWRMGQWNSIPARKQRPLSSVVLKEGQLEDLLTRFKSFFSQESWYVERGISYQLGVSFVGPPGTGKSSLILALAGHFKYNVYVLNLNSLNDSELTQAFASVAENAIFVVEDIDAYFEGRNIKTTRPGSVTFDGFLNAVDGLMNVHGRILCITTNHEEVLDEAMIRKGRIDVRLVLSATDSSQRRRLFEAFYPEHKHLAAEFEALVDALPRPTAGRDFTPAEIQGMFMDFPRDPEGLVKSLAQQKTA